MQLTNKFRQMGRKRIGAFALALVMVFCAVISVGPEAFAVTKEEINNLKSQASSLSSQKSDLQKQLNKLENSKNAAIDEKFLLEEKIGVIQQQITVSEEAIAKYGEMIALKEVELAEAKEEEAKYYAEFCERVRSMEERGDISYWAVLFNASSFSDLVDRVNAISEVVDYDNMVMDQLAAARQAVADAKTELETDRTEQKAVREEQVAQKAELVEKLSQADALVDEIAAKEDEYQHAIKELEAAAAEVDKLVAAKQAEYERLISSGKITIDAGSGFMWPLSGYTTLSSLFGPRIHPVTGKPGNHTGIDIPAPKGTSILASRGGVVITSKMGSGNDWSYGNYVVISHGDGTSTLYAHMNSRAVKEGDVVKQGQTIGYVGTTGRSTGYHLHFEVRKSGSRVDPVDYFPSMTLYVRSGGQVVKLKH